MTTFIKPQHIGFLQIQERTNKNASYTIETQNCPLTFRSVQQLPANTTVHVITGKAWITVDNHDQFLCAGDEFRLARRGQAGLISNAGSTSLTYEIVKR